MKVKKIKFLDLNFQTKIIQKTQTKIMENFKISAHIPNSFLAKENNIYSWDK